MAMRFMCKHRNNNNNIRISFAVVSYIRKYVSEMLVLQTSRIVTGKINRGPIETTTCVRMRSDARCSRKRGDKPNLMTRNDDFIVFRLVLVDGCTPIV